MKAKAKVSPPKKKARQPARKGRDWQRLCEAVRKERNRLRKELARVKKERDDYRRTVCALMHEDIEFSKEEILARVGQGPSFEELVAEVAAELESREAG